MESDLDLTDIPGIPVLVGIGGSHAYGLATPESDVDYRGCYVAPTRKFFGLTPPVETYDRHDPDIALHEVGKLLRLALSANPTVLELFYYEKYGIKHSVVGSLLISCRDMFLSEKIRATHIGFAMSQLGRLKNREYPDSSARDKRVAKHARHLLRLIQQAERVLTTGVFDIKVADREEIFAFGEMPYNDMVKTAEAAIDRLRAAPSVLPAEPDRDAVNELLIDIRTVALDW